MSLIKCSECGKEISDKAAACPHCGCPVEISLSKIEKQAKSAKEEKPKAAFKPNYAMTIEEPKQKQSEGSFAFGIIIACVVLTFAIVGYAMIRPEPKTRETPEVAKTSNPANSRPRPGVPYAFAKSFVKDYLVSPKTAEFAPISEARCVLLPDQKTWKIISFVDSQNNFGAIVRTKWYVKIIDTGNGWKLLDIKFGDEI